MTKKPTDHMAAGEIEIRAFMQLKQLFDKRKWPFPYFYKLEKECSAAELAQKLDLPPEQIEAVFINGKAQSLEESRVRPGDRVAFLPPGTPGPHRFLMGIAKLPER